jgi:hypothetical protein
MSERPKILTAVTVPTGGWDLKIYFSVAGAYDTDVTVTIPAGTYFLADDGQDDDFIRVLNTEIQEGLGSLALIDTTWTARTTASDDALYGVTWGAGLFVAVGATDGADAHITTSPTGATWTERANSKSFDLFDVTYGNGLFVAVGAADGTDAYIVTSPDGITWTERANPKNFALYGVCWSGSLFVAVGAADGTDAYIVTSPDGITWTERANAKNFALSGVCYSSALSLSANRVIPSPRAPATSRGPRPRGSTRPTTTPDACSCATSPARSW